MQLSVHQAKDQFSALLQAVERGEEVVITRHGKKIARIVHEPETELSESERAQALQRALDDLRSYQSGIKPAVDGHTDWKSLRDAGRRE